MLLDHRAPWEDFSGLESVWREVLGDPDAAHDATCWGAHSSEESEAQQAYWYPLRSGGKRVRAQLLLMMACASGGEEAARRAIPAAAALELVHTYSLVHDDLPCMDDDDYRRGRLAVHRVFGEAQGLLVGDALLTQAFECLAHVQPIECVPVLVRLLAQRAGAQGMVLGQWLDLAAEAQVQGSLPDKGQQDAQLRSHQPMQQAQDPQAEWARLVRIHERKTGMLLAAAFEMGLVCGLAPQSAAPWLKHAAQLGIALGLAFQIVDDVLDATQSSTVLGKTAGKDAKQSKLTAVSVLGLEEAKRRAAQLTVAVLEGLEQLFTQVPKVNDPWVEQARAALRSLIENLLDRRF